MATKRFFWLNFDLLETYEQDCLHFTLNSALCTDFNNRHHTTSNFQDSSTPPPVPSKVGCTSSAAPPVPSKNATTAKELRDLMYKHYCVGKGKLKKPSANAIKKGKVPPPNAGCQLNNQKPDPKPAGQPHQHCSKGPDSDTDELSEDDDDVTDDTSSETSKVCFKKCKEC